MAYCSPCPGRVLATLGTDLGQFLVQFAPPPSKVARLSSRKQPPELQITMTLSLNEEEGAVVKDTDSVQKLS